MLKPFQQSDSFCGPASLKIALGHFGINKTEKELARMTDFKRSVGIEAEDMLRVAKKLGLKGFVKDFSTIKEIRKNIKDKNKVIIVEWFLEDDGHFTVVSGIDRENIYLQDPQLGHMRAMKIGLFLRLWFTFPDKYIKTKDDLRLRRMIVLHK